jgi:ribosomal protein S18 acetylase RimI-like enzyme
VVIPHGNQRILIYGCSDVMFRLRSYGDDDAEAVLTIWWDSWHSILPGISHPQTFVNWRSRWFTDVVPARTIVVAVDEQGAVVGFAAANLLSRELTQLFVAPAFKGLGIGRQLLCWAQNQMPTGFRLHTLTQNVASRIFYDRCGLIEGSTGTSPFNGMETIEYRWAPSPGRNQG